MELQCQQMNQVTGAPCTAPAELTIIATTGHPDDQVFSCIAHCGDMLGTVSTAKWGSYHHLVYAVNE